MDILDRQDAQCILEAALLCAHQPMTIRELRVLFDDALPFEEVKALLHELAERWQGRGAELRETGSGWRFQTRAEVQEYLDRLHPEKPPRYSRATMETLAIIAYRQPVTRGDIEDIRGVTVSTQIVKQLEDRGWIEVIGHRDAPGRPGLYATTRQFLDDLGLSSLEQLPELDHMGAVQALLPELQQADGGAQEAEQGEATAVPESIPGEGTSPLDFDSSNVATGATGATEAAEGGADETEPLDEAEAVDAAVIAEGPEAFTQVPDQSPAEEPSSTEPPQAASPDPAEDAPPAPAP